MKIINRKKFNYIINLNFVSKEMSTVNELTFGLSTAKELHRINSFKDTSLF